MGILKTLTINGTTYKVVNTVPADSVTLLASAWEGDGEVYSQVVEVPGVTAHTKVDLQPTAEQLADLHYKILAFVAENDGGTVTVYSIGDKPDGDHTIQITKTEVDGTGKIRGNTVGTTMPRPDWNQGDPTKADYIRNKPYVTPQMFGAVGDGVADDTEAVQAVLDNGGHIYFPAGRYKVTQRLTVSKSCRIEMFKQYPNTYKAEYPLTPADNWMGARIDTYSPNGGMVIGDAVEVDGLYIRAMEGFKGVVLKFDNTIGTYTYPAAVRLKHIKLEIDSHNTIPVSMFDFMPNGSYHYILEDICLGRNGDAGYCEYGFRTDLSQTPQKWAYNVIIRNLCIDLHADYPLYVAGDAELGISAWQFDALNIQAYSYTKEGSIENNNSRQGHTNLITLKNAYLTTFISSYLWDTAQATIKGEAISLENVRSTAVIGCSGHFDTIESYYKPKFMSAENLNITNLEMAVEDNADGTANTLILTDGTNERAVDIPKVQMTDEQIGNAVGTWMDANAEPREESGKNKFNYASDKCIIAAFAVSENRLVTLAQNPDITNWVTDYIKVRKGDIIRLSLDGVNKNPYIIGCYNSSNEIIGFLSGFGWDNLSSGIEITVEGTASIRMELNTSTFGEYDNRADREICVTVNDADTTFEEYYTELVGGIGSFMALKSPNGTKYTLSVTDDGTLIAVPATTQ